MDTRNEQTDSYIVLLDAQISQFFARYAGSSQPQDEVSKISHLYPLVMDFLSNQLICLFFVSPTLQGFWLSADIFNLLNYALDVIKNYEEHCQRKLQYFTQFEDDSGSTPHLHKLNELMQLLHREQAEFAEFLHIVFAMQQSSLQAAQLERSILQNLCFLQSLQNQSLLLLLQNIKAARMRDLARITLFYTVQAEIIQRIYSGAIFTEDLAANPVYHACIYPGPPETYDSRALNEALDAQYQAKYDAFIKTYSALRAGQTRLVKTDYLQGKEHLTPQQFIKDVIAYAKQHPDSRAAKAWELTQSHYRNCSATRNPKLFTEVYKWSLAHSRLFKLSMVSGLTLFKSSTFNEKVGELSAEQIQAGSCKPDSRTARICRKLC